MPENADYHHRINPDLLRLIPGNAATVLEIGCAAGQLGAAYKRSNPACRYLGVELDESIAEKARQHLDQVWSGNVEEFSPSVFRLKRGSVDCLVYGNVLEHLNDPWALLAAQVPLLKPDGVVLACIPNVQHWSILAGLMQGSWRYRDEGLLDRTHLRFFTLDTVSEMFEAAGLVVFEVRGRRFDEAGFKDFYQALEPALEALNFDKARFQTHAGILQFVVRATRIPVTASMLVQSLMIPTQAACNDVRIIHVNECLVTIPGIEVIQEVGIASLPKTTVSDKIFILQRPILKYSDLALIEKVVNAGYLVIAEFDDHPLRWPGIEEKNYLEFRYAHAVQTSTPALGNYFRQFNPEVAVFPNQLKELPTLRDIAETDAPLTVFFGALNREQDWEPLMPAINELIKRNAGRIRFEVIHDLAFFDALQTRDKRFTPMCPYDRYCEILADSDIALLPLADTEFNVMKSDLKFIEAAAHGAVALASPAVYADTIEAGKTGLLFHDVHEFSRQFQRLVELFKVRDKLRRNAYRYVASNRLLSQHIASRLEWYRHLLNNRKKLEKQRQKRIATMSW